MHSTIRLRKLKSCWKKTTKHMKNFILLPSLLLLGLTGKSQIYTPNYVQVPQSALFTYSNSGFNTDSQLQSFQNNVQNGLYGSSCVVVAGYSRNYNCHGYAWHVSTGGSHVAIDQPNAGGVDYYTNGSNPSYSQTSFNGSQNNLRVRWTGDHSAVTTNNGLYTSKWGAGPMVRHNATDVPNGYGSPNTYWTCNYTPPLTSVNLDYSPVSGSFIPLNYGNHNMQISWGLTPDTGPIWGSTAASTTISSQSGGSVNFSFSGPSNNGGLSIQFCGTYRHSFTFYKPSGGRIGVFPNPAREETTVVMTANDTRSDLIAINLDEQVNKMVRLQLVNERNEVIGDYSTAIEGNRSTLKLGGLSKGTYYLKATFADGSNETKRVIVQP